MIQNLYENTISRDSAEAYENKLNELIQRVNKIMTRKKNLGDLIGDNKLSVMYDNHENHARFILNVISLQDFELLENTLPWVLKSYRARGFALAYFTEVLQAWKSAMHDVLPPKANEEIVRVYDYMIERIPMLELELENEDDKGPDAASDSKKAEPHTATSSPARLLQEYLLQGDFQPAKNLISSELENSNLQHIYLNIIQPAMYAIGDKWERGDISVAHEHLATSIIMRLISFFYPQYVIREPTKQKVVVTAAANEYHELGARMVADLLEIDGWDVFYLGSNTPDEDLLYMIKSEEIQFLCVSVTMTFNFTRIKSLIEKIRSDASLSGVRIMIGGGAFNFSSHLHKKLGADAFGTSALESLIILNGWGDNEHDETQ